MTLTLPSRLEASLGALLLVILTGTVLLIPWKATLAAVVAIPAAAVFFARPREALLAVFAMRIVVDLFHWVPMNMGGLNLLEGFGGGVAALAAALFYLELRRVEKTPGFLALAVYLGVLVVAAARSGERARGALVQGVEGVHAVAARFGKLAGTPPMCKVNTYRCLF